MSIVVDKRAGAETLVLAFTGFNLRLGMPNERFFASAGLENASKIVVTDEARRLTLDGIGDDLDTFTKVLDYLRAEIRSAPHSTLLVTGNSGGAHSAILYGHLLKADRVVCFAPITYLDPATVRANGDPLAKRQGRSLAYLKHLPREVSEYHDLDRPLSESNGVTEYFIHVSRYEKWDYKRANHLRGLPNVTIRAHPYTSHAVLSELEKSGHLERCFSAPFQQSFDLRGYLRVWLKIAKRDGRKVLRSSVKKVLRKARLVESMRPS